MKTLQGDFNLIWFYIGIIHFLTIMLIFIDCNNQYNNSKLFVMFRSGRHLVFINNIIKTLFIASQRFAVLQIDH